MIPAHSAEIEFQASAGAGRQYSGLIGAQVSLGTSRARVYAGAGLLTFSVGVDVALTKHLSTGIYNYVGFASPFGKGGHLSYHFNGVFSKGFSVGGNITQISESDPTKLDDPDKTELMLAIGYQF